MSAIINAAESLNGNAMSKTNISHEEKIADTLYHDHWGYDYFGDIDAGILGFRHGHEMIEAEEHIPAQVCCTNVLTININNRVVDLTEDLLSEIAVKAGCAKASDVINYKDVLIRIYKQYNKHFGTKIINACDPWIENQSKRLKAEYDVYNYTEQVANIRQILKKLKCELDSEVAEFMTVADQDIINFDYIEDIIPYEILLVNALGKLSEAGHNLNKFNQDRLDLLNQETSAMSTNVVIMPVETKQNDSAKLPTTSEAGIPWLEKRIVAEHNRKPIDSVKLLRAEFYLAAWRSQPHLKSDNLEIEFLACQRGEGAYAFNTIYLDAILRALSPILNAKPDDFTSDQVVIWHKLLDSERRKELRKIARTAGIDQRIIDDHFRFVNDTEKLPYYMKWLGEMNKKYWVANSAGTVVVMTELYDETLSRNEIKIMTAGSLKLLHDNEMVQTGVTKQGDPIYERKASAWLKQTRRRTYSEGVYYLPGSDVVPNGVYNLWNGWAFEPKKGDISKFKAHILDNICSGNQDHYNYLWGWMAKAFQNPNDPGFTAVVLRSKKGTGKNILADAFARLFGRHGMVITNPVHLTGQFNGHLINASFVCLNEAVWGGDKRHEGVLKGLVTDTVLPVEEKYMNATQTRNRTHIMIIGNEEWIVPASEDERRYFVLDVSPQHKDDYPYFEAINNGICPPTPSGAFPLGYAMG